MSVTRYGGKPVFRLFASEACPAQPPAVRSGTDAQIVLIAPIYQIMAALLTRPGVVADLISRNASRSRHCASHLEQIGGMVRIGGREFALAHQRVEPGARLNREDRKSTRLNSSP